MWGEVKSVEQEAFLPQLQELDILRVTSNRHSDGAARKG